MDARIPFAGAAELNLLLSQQLRRIGPLGAIVVLHIGLFYALQSGLLRQAAQALPQDMVAAFIALQPAPDTPPAQAATPKTVPIVRKAAPPPTPAAPAVDTMPSPHAITTAQTAPVPTPAEPVAPAAVAMQAAPAPALPKMITSGIEYLQAPQPIYPPQSKRMGEEGKALLRVLVNDRGRPERVELQKSSGSARLDEAARQAVLRAIFKPFMEDGKTVAAYAIIPIRFQLDN